MTRKNWVLKLSSVLFASSMLMMLASLPLLNQLENIYQLEFSPANFSTDAMVDQELETIEFQNLDQWIELPIESFGFHLLEIVTSGGVFTDGIYQEDVPTLTLSINQSVHHLQTDLLISTIQYRWFQAEPGLMRISFTNFVKMSEGMVYTLIIQDIYLHG
jgi:hypothetical protein